MLETNYEIVFRKVSKRFKNNQENRETYRMENRNEKGEETGTLVILNGDPLSSKLDELKL